MALSPALVGALVGAGIIGPQGLVLINGLLVFQDRPLTLSDRPMRISNAN